MNVVDLQYSQSKISSEHHVSYILKCYAGLGAGTSPYHAVIISITSALRVHGQIPGSACSASAYRLIQWRQLHQDRVGKAAIA